MAPGSPLDQADPPTYTDALKARLAQELLDDNREVTATRRGLTMTVFLIVVAGVHALFMIFELFPWSSPLLLGRVSKELPDLPADARGTESSKWSDKQQPLVATIVHNAGIYNGIVAGGLMWAAATGDLNVARVMLAGAAVAGIFGTATLKSKAATAAQAAFGIAGLFLLSRS